MSWKALVGAILYVLSRNVIPPARVDGNASALDTVGLALTMYCMQYYLVLSWSVPANLNNDITSVCQ